MSQYTKTVDESNLTLTIERRFQAPRNVIWDFFTKRHLIEQWWGPEGFPTTSKSFDFRVGGQWHYHMTGPDGTRYWALTEYTAIDDGASFEYNDYFSDESGARTSDLPAPRARIEFRDDGAETLVVTTLKFESLDALRQLIEMGFEEGFDSQCGKLDALLAARSQR